MQYLAGYLGGGMGEMDEQEDTTAVWTQTGHKHLPV